MKTLKLAIIYAVAIMFMGFAAFQTIPDKLLMIFNASDLMLEIGVPALKTISLSFMFAGYCIVCSSMFQALGHGMMSLITSVVRQLVVLLPVAFLLSKTGNVTYVWYAFPIAEIFSLTLSTFFLIKIYKTNIAPLKAHEEN